MYYRNETQVYSVTTCSLFQQSQPVPGRGFMKWIEIRENLHVLGLVV